MGLYHTWKQNTLQQQLKEERNGPVLFFLDSYTLSEGV